MSHYLSESESSSVAEQIAAWEEVEQRAKTAMSTLRALQARFPDVVDRGRWKENARWGSKAAHEFVTHFDPTNGALYLEVEGGGRIYSGRPVCLAEGFALFQSPGYKGTLIDALRSTTKLAEQREAEHAAKRALEEAADAQQQQAKEAAAAQPVRIVVVHPR